MRSVAARAIASRSAAAGAVMYVGMRWFDRLIGVVSTIVLARLLTPDDFGIVALAFVVLGLASVMLDLGINIAVVQRSELDRSDIDTAWTIRLLQNTTIACVLLVAAPFVSTYYGEARLEAVLRVLSFAYFLDGMTGMGPVIFQKRQQYAREVGFFMTKRLIGFTVTLLLAFWLRTYWALVLGVVCGNAAGVVLSHWMYREIPRITLLRWRAFVGASLWLALRSMGSYLTQEMDKLVVGRRDGSAALGTYSIAAQVAAMPTSELLAPLSRALFPALAAIKDDLQRLREVFLTALGIQCTLALPASVGLAMVATDLVVVMLGEKWLGAVPILVALSFAYGANALTHSGGYLLTTLGKYQVLSILEWSMAGLLVFLIFVAFPFSGATEIAWLRTIYGAVNVLAITTLTRRYLSNVSVGDFLRVVYRPAISAVTMAVWIEQLYSRLAGLPFWVALGAKVLSGALVYAASLLILWQIAGRPAGAEKWIIERVRSVLPRAA